MIDRLEPSERLGLRYAPPVLRDMGERIEKNGLVTHEFARVLEEANININVEGDVEPWAQEGQGAILIGDHRMTFESWPLLGVLGALEREDVRLLARQFSSTARIMGSIGVEASQLVLPVMSRNFAKERPTKNIFNRDFYIRIYHRTRLPTLEALEEMNTKSLLEAAEFVDGGGLTIIYPVGKSIDALTASWQNGIGKIIKGISPDKHSSTILVPFRFDDFSRFHFVTSLIKHSKGINTKPQNITLRLGAQSTIEDMFGDQLDNLSPYQVTELLRLKFINDFGGEE